MTAILGGLLREEFFEKAAAGSTIDPSGQGDIHCRGLDYFQKNFVP